MKREGRQHGLVRTYPIIPSPWSPRPNSRSSHSCCHIHPAGKAKDKAKGTRKLRGCDIVSRPGFTFFGLSATSILDHLATEYMDLDDDEFYHGVGNVA